LSDLSSSVLHVFLPTSIHIFTAVPNPVLRANNFFYSYAILDELEERGVGSISGYSPSSCDEY
jgi:hypothetical protein